MAADAKLDNEHLPGMAKVSNDNLVMVKAALHGARKTWRDSFR